MRHVFFHGSPTGRITEFKPYTFFSASEAVARLYACGQMLTVSVWETKKDGPTVYAVEIEIDKSVIFDMRDRDHMYRYDEARVAWNAVNGKKDEGVWYLPKRDREGFVMSLSGLPGHGFARPMMRAMPEFHAMWIDEGTMEKSLLVAAPKDHVRIVKRIPVICG